MRHINQQHRARCRWEHYFDQLGFVMEGASFDDQFFTDTIKVALTPLKEYATTERLQAFMEFLHRNGVILEETSVVVQKIVSKKPSWIGQTDLTLPPFTVTFHIEGDYWEQISRFAVMDSLHALHFLEHELFWHLQ